MREREREREFKVGLGSDKEVRMKNYSSFHLEVQSVSCFFCVNITCELGYLENKFFLLKQLEEIKQRKS